MRLDLGPRPRATAARRRFRVVGRRRSGSSNLATRGKRPQHGDGVADARSPLGSVLRCRRCERSTGRSRSSPARRVASGSRLAEMFVAEGMTAVLADVDERRLREVESSLASRGAEVAAMVCDTSSERRSPSSRRSRSSRFGGAHVLCNNAGHRGRG